MDISFTVNMQLLSSSVPNRALLRRLKESCSVGQVDIPFGMDDVRSCLHPEKVETMTVGKLVGAIKVRWSRP